MNASRSLTPGGWFHFWDNPPPGPAEAHLTACAGAVHGSMAAVSGRNWLLIGGVMLMLAGRLAGGAEVVFPTTAHGDNEFSITSPVFYTKDAPSDAQVLQRVSNSAGLRGIFSLTRNQNMGSAYPESTRGSLFASAPHSYSPHLPPGPRSLAVFAAGAIWRHFEKLSTWSDQSGAGVIYPFNSCLGVFVDARTITSQGTRYYGVARTGLRILF
jgi:hypothetical protein